MPTAAFKTPTVIDNDEGWGPTTVPEQLEGVPYAPYSKGEKVGRVSDFTAGAFNKYGGRYGNQQGGPTVFNFFHNEEEDSFHLVDARPPQRRQGVRRFQPNRFQQRRDQQAQRGEPQGGREDRLSRKQQAKRPQFFHRNEQRQVVYSCSVDIRPEWPLSQQITFADLGKLAFTAPEAEDLAFCGRLSYYDKTYDRVTAKGERPLRHSSRTFRSITTSDDPVLRRLAKDSDARVFLTDTLLTAMMCAPRSVYSWDIVATRAGDKLFFDKREGSVLDQVTVGETSPEPVLEDKDSPNGVQQLSAEATAINQAFSQQVLVQDGPKYETEEPNPFLQEGEKEEQLASIAYRYRRLPISPEVSMVVRYDVNAVMTYKGEDQLLAVHALNEYDPRATGVDWRQKLETQRGAALATELKNNACKLARWTAAALVAGVDLLKLGYVSRASPRDNHAHAILGTQVCKPKDFAVQINLSMENCWGIVRALVDLCLALEEGKYLLVKDPAKPLLRLYQVPEDAFQEHYTEDPLQEGDDADAEEEAEAAPDAAADNEE